MSQGCALWILRSKGQRSRSWRMVIWKWFPDDNWLCNQPMIMKLHTLTPHEFVGVGGGPVLLQQYFQYAFICCPYMLPLLFENGFRTITDSVINLWSWNFIHLLPMNLLGSVGDLYCFSNTFSMLLYVAPICCPSCSMITIQKAVIARAKMCETDLDRVTYK